MAQLDPNRDRDTIAYGTFRGIRNDVDPERFELADLAVGTNINLDKTGQPSRRDGYARLSATATHSLWAASDLALCVQGTTLYRLSPSYALTPLRNGLTAGRRMSYAFVNDRVYFSNGAETGLFKLGDIAARSWGLVPPRPPLVQVGTGSMPAGTYQYACTYLRSDGQESGATIAGTIVVPAGGALLFALVPSSDPDVVAQSIYISTPNGDVLYFADTVANSATSYTYIEDTKELALDLATQFLTPPPAGHLVTYYRGHVLVAVDDVIYPSQPFGPELFDLREYIPLDGRVTMMARIEDKERSIEGFNSGLFIGTDRSCGILMGSSPKDFKYVPKVDYGAIEGALDYVDGTLIIDGGAGARMLPMWLSMQGVCVGMPQLDIKNLSRAQYSSNPRGQGAAIFIPGPNRFITVSDN